MRTRKTANTWNPSVENRGRLDVSDAYLIAWYTRARHIFSVLKEDQEIWLQFGIEIDSLRPKNVRLEAVELQDKLLWDWMRAHGGDLGL